MGLKTRASEEFVSVLKRLVGLLPQMNDEDKDRVFDFVILAEQSYRPLELVFRAEQLLSKYDPQFALEKEGEALESKRLRLANALKLREGLKQLEIDERKLRGCVSREEAKRVFFALDRVQFSRVKDTKDKRSVPVNQWWGQRR